MTTILVLFAALVGGGQPCAEAISLESCDALLSEGVPPIQDLGHIAVVKPPWERKAEASAPAESMPSSEPEATPDPQPEPTASIEPAPEAVATVAAPEEPSTPSAWVVQVAAFEEQA